MNYTYENILSSSFLLFLKNRLENQYQGYYNVGTLFYPLIQTYQGYTSYSAPFRSWVSDAGVSGASVLTGVYMNGSFITKGQSGLAEIDYNNGNLYFTGTLPPNAIISGNYSISEVDVVMASFPDVVMLFETRLPLRPKYPIVPSGLFNNRIAYPAIFLKNELGENKPFAFGGLDETKTIINAYVFAESQFQLDAVCSCCKDMNYKYVPYLNANEQPFDAMGGFKNNLLYNYTGLVGNRVSAGQGVLIDNVAITDWGRRGINSEISKMTTESFFSLITFTLRRERVTI